MTADRDNKVSTDSLFITQSVYHHLWGTEGKSTAANLQLPYSDETCTRTYTYTHTHKYAVTYIHSCKRPHDVEKRAFSLQLSQNDYRLFLTKTAGCFLFFCCTRTRVNLTRCQSWSCQVGSSSSRSGGPGGGLRPPDGNRSTSPRWPCPTPASPRGWCATLHCAWRGERTHSGETGLVILALC